MNQSNNITILELFSEIGGFTKGFQDDWIKYGVYTNKKGESVTKEIPKTQRYKLCGNAVTVAVVKAIAERVKLT